MTDISLHGPTATKQKASGIGHTHYIRTLSVSLIFLSTIFFLLDASLLFLLFHIALCRLLLSISTRTRSVVFLAKSNSSFGMNKSALTLILSHKSCHPTKDHVVLHLSPKQHSEVQNRHSGERLVGPGVQHRGRFWQPSRRSAHLHQNHLQQGETTSSGEAAGCSEV